MPVTHDAVRTVTFLKSAQFDNLDEQGFTMLDSHKSGFYSNDKLLRVEAGGGQTSAARWTRAGAAVVRRRRFRGRRCSEAARRGKSDGPVGDVQCLRHSTARQQPAARRIRRVAGEEVAVEERAQPHIEALRHADPHAAELRRAAARVPPPAAAEHHTIARLMLSLLCILDHTLSSSVSSHST